MSISITRYVNIVSGVGAGASVATRDLILRLMTNNTLVPTQAIVEMTTLKDVGDYFGFTSAEYLRAQQYFGTVSKIITSPKKISFGFLSTSAQQPRVYGGVFTAGLAALQAVSAGNIIVTIGGTALTLTNVNLSGAASLTNVAGLLQTAIRTGVGAVFTAATVAYNATTGRFQMEGGVSGANTIDISNTTSGVQLAPLLKWLESNGAIHSDGTPARSITELMTATANISTNFGSFANVQAQTIEQIVEAATWNDAQNVRYWYTVQTTAANAAAWSAALINLSGVSLTLGTGYTNAIEFPELAPVATLASTDYLRAGSTQNYMYQLYSLTPTVNSDADANTYDNLRVNYYGRTQSAGQAIDFYQRGVMMGLSTDPTDMNTYGNEMWLKDFLTAKLLELQLGMPKVPANETGRGMLLNTVQEGVNAALYNGVISVGKELTSTQKAFITNITADGDAWRQVENIGYWLNVDIRTETIAGAVSYYAVYTLIYSKDDVVRRIDGSNILI